MYWLRRLPLYWLRRRFDAMTPDPVSRASIATSRAMMLMICERRRRGERSVSVERVKRVERRADRSAPVRGAAGPRQSDRGGRSPNAPTTPPRRTEPRFARTEGIYTPYNHEWRGGRWAAWFGGGILESGNEVCHVDSNVFHRLHPRRTPQYGRNLNKVPS